MRASALALGCAILASAPAQAQPVTLEQLAQRVEALERENGELREEIRELKVPRSAAPQATSDAGADNPPAAPSAVSLSPSPASASASASPRQDRTWAGGYAGLTVGLQRDRYSDGYQPGLSFQAKDTRPGFGLQAGYRWQRGPLVAGVETSFNLSHGHRVAILADPNLDLFLLEDMRESVRTTGQLGAGWGHWLVYGTVGAEIAKIRAENTYYRGWAVNKITVGRVLGLGAGYRTASGASLEIEYTDTDFGGLVDIEQSTHTRDRWDLRLNQGF